MSLRRVFGRFEVLEWIVDLWVYWLRHVEVYIKHLHGRLNITPRAVDWCDRRLGRVRITIIVFAGLCSGILIRRTHG